MDHEAISEHGDSTFWDNFKRDLGVVCPVVDMTIDDGERPHGGAVVPAGAGIGYNGRFAVLAEESEDEAEPELLFQRRSCFPNRILWTLNLFINPRPEVPRWRWIQSRNAFLCQYLQLDHQHAPSQGSLHWTQ